MKWQKWKINLALLSDAMPGSGVGTELLNDLVPRDHDGNVIVPASHLKGLVRQQLLDLAEIRGYNSERFLAQVLGHPGDSIGSEGNDGNESIVAFENLRLRVDGGGARQSEQRITRTALNQHGTIEKNSLRTNESVSVGSTFEGVVYSRSEPNSWQDIAIKLALVSLDAIGGSRNRGAGFCLVKIDGESRRPGELLKLLDSKKHEMEARFRQTTSVSGRSLSTKTTWLELVFDAHSPICCPEMPTSSSNNVLQSGFVIPASAVQGAVLTTIDRVDTALASACFDSAQFRCWPLQPAGLTSNEAAGVFPVRVATSHRISKLPDSSTGEHNFRDSIIEPYDWREVAKGSPLKGGDGVLLRGRSAVKLWRSGDMPRTWSAHGVHNGAATSVERNLFQVTALVPMILKGLMACPEDAAEKIIETINGSFVSFGRSRSVRGGGILTARKIDSLSDYLDWNSESPLYRRVFVVQSPVAVPDTVVNFGAAEDQLASLVALPIAEQVALNGFTASGILASAKVLFGWNRHGNGSKADSYHNRLRARRVITPGSVFVLRNPIDDIESFLLKGIGEGKQEGLGNILPHPGIAQSKYARQRESLPVINSVNSAGSWGVKLHQLAPAVSPSQIARVAAIAEQQSPENVLKFIDHQLRGRSARIWDRWKFIEAELQTLCKHPADLAAALRVWQDLAIGRRMQSQKEQV